MAAVESQPRPTAGQGAHHQFRDLILGQPGRTLRMPYFDCAAGITVEQQPLVGHRVDHVDHHAMLGFKGPGTTSHYRLRITTVSRGGRRHRQRVVLADRRDAFGVPDLIAPVVLDLDQQIVAGGAGRTHGQRCQRDRHESPK
ncbi:MAG: hypothetical protein IPG52_05390 [Rhodocyclaceae bacterium]|nr:hypothetical protein [Rhodocyclaceae bacterium]